MPHLVGLVIVDGQPVALVGAHAVDVLTGAEHVDRRSGGSSR